MKKLTCMFVVLMVVGCGGTTLINKPVTPNSEIESLEPEAQVNPTEKSVETRTVTAKVYKEPGENETKDVTTTIKKGETLDLHKGPLTVHYVTVSENLDGFEAARLMETLGFECLSQFALNNLMKLEKYEKYFFGQTGGVSFNLVTRDETGYCLSYMVRNGFNDEDHHHYDHEAYTFVGSAIKICPKVDLPDLDDVYPVTVNGSQKLDEAIKAGNYSHVDIHIVDRNFPDFYSGEPYQVDIELKAIDRRMNTDQVLEELDKLGYRPVTLAEFLKFGEIYPNAQLAKKLIFIDQWWAIFSRMRNPILNQQDCERALSLTLFYPSHEWREGDIFLVVRK